MKKYRIWLANNQIIEIEAKSIEVDYHKEFFKPRKISFVDDRGHTISEFYCDMICGWAEINPKLNHEGEDKE